MGTLTLFAIFGPVILIAGVVVAAVAGVYTFLHKRKNKKKKVNWDRFFKLKNKVS